MRYFFIFLCLISSSYAKQLEIDLFSKNVILINPDNNAILYEKKAYEKASPASTTKIATTLYVLDKKKELLNEKVEVSSEAMHPIFPNDKVNNNYRDPSYWLETDGTEYGLKIGEFISFRTLLHALMLVSGNDCANVISEAASGNIPLFMNELNSFLQSIGCNNTHFCNPHGLHHPDHYTTAYEMAFITKRALSIPLFRQIVSTLSYTTAETNKQKSREISNFNRIMNEGTYYYPYAIGVKTGFHSNAGNNLVAAAEKEGRTLIAVLMGGEKKTYRYIDAKRLFDAAFDQQKEKKRIFDKDKEFNVKIEGAKDNLNTYLTDEFIYEYYPAESVPYKVFIKWNDLKLPIAKDAIVGEIQLISDNGYILASTSLYSKKKVKKTLFGTMKDFFRFLF